MLILCNRCVRGVKSRGETILVREIENSDESACCDWCDTPDTVLYGAYFPEYSFGSSIYDDY